MEAWRAEVLAANWSNPHELKSRYPKATLIGERNVVFNIRYNRYRLHVTIDYASASVIVRRIGTHAQYDRWTF
ncbi:MAG: type II toxin-antitoxin system HigB family toxin [Gemmatimonadaceae bacterium]